MPRASLPLPDTVSPMSCSASGPGWRCSRAAVVAKGLCTTHYQQMRRAVKEGGEPVFRPCREDMAVLLEEPPKEGMSIHQTALRLGLPDTAVWAAEQSGLAKLRTALSGWW